MKAVDQIVLGNPGTRTLTITRNSDGSIRVEMNDEMYGDSETGFGATIELEFGAADVERLHHFIRGDETPPVAISRGSYKVYHQEGAFPDEPSNPPAGTVVVGRNGKRYRVGDGP